LVYKLNERVIKKNEDQNWIQNNYGLNWKTRLIKKKKSNQKNEGQNWI
jgi:hypothetical protein